MGWRRPASLVVLVGASLTTFATPASARVTRELWPEAGEAAYVVDAEPVAATPHQRPVPIASVAKVMTAYLVLQAWPLTNGRDGFSFRVTGQDVENTVRREFEDQSVVPVRVGERLTERQALQALLLPSANNVAVMLARRIAGSVSAFVAHMNRTAAQLHMTRTVYTDPSGFLPSTRSTAVDQLRLACAAMLVPAFAHIVDRRSVRIPVAGRTYNTDALLGRDGFTGIKTGSDSAAGGCFAFRAEHRVGGASMTITGVVLGQPGGDLVSAGLDAAHRLVDHVISEARH